MPVILSVSQSSATTDVNGLASIVPSSGGFSPPVEVDVAVTAGVSDRLDDPLELLPGLSDASTGTSSPVSRIPVHISRPVRIEKESRRNVARDVFAEAI